MLNPEPLQTFINTGDDGSALLLMLFPDGWVCISVTEGEGTDGFLEYKSSFIRLEDLENVVTEMNKADDEAATRFVGRVHAEQERINREK